MIDTFLLTGDTHSDVITRVAQADYLFPGTNSNVALIILGDAGLNFYLNNKEKRQKEEIARSGYRLYLVRGNHEQDPSDLGYDTIYDEDVCGEVFVDPVADCIRYLKDGGEYVFGEYSALVIGGAYSVDKYHRLARAKEQGSSFSGWFEHEQLSAEAMTAITKQMRDKHYDFVFSHTCPYSWEPTDLFLGFVDQSTVDNTMEKWMDELKETFDWSVWCFGHFHADRVELPHVEMLYQEIEPLEVVAKRWIDYDKGEPLPWWIPVSPKMERLNELSQ